MSAETVGYIIVEHDVTHERLEGEVIAVNLVTGRYYSMSGPAADIWTVAVEGLPLTDIVDRVRASYADDTVPDSDIIEFLDACVNAGLLRVVAAKLRPVGAIIPDDYSRASWTVPHLEEYEDLQDLILVDPVHDTAALGWPHVDDTRDDE